MGIGKRVNKTFSSLGEANGYEVVNTSSNYTARSNDLIVVDTSGATLPEGSTAYTITLPSSPKNGDIVLIMDGSGNAQNRPVLVDGVSSNIDGQADDLTCDVNYFDIKLTYNNGNWSLGGK